MWAASLLCEIGQKKGICKTTTLDLTERRKKHSQSIMYYLGDKSTTPTGFEPARRNSSRFRICLLNHSDTVSLRGPILFTIINFAFIHKPIGFFNIDSRSHLDAYQTRYWNSLWGQVYFSLWVQYIDTENGKWLILMNQYVPWIPLILWNLGWNFVLQLI